MTVDEYVTTKINPELHEAANALRAVVRDCAPSSEEAVSYAMIVFRVGKPTFGWINPAPTSLTLGFRRGVDLDDKFGVLHGKGKHARHIRIKSLADVDTEILRHYITSAVALDQG